MPDSAAAKAGFQPGDLVVSIDGKAIDSFGDMQKIVSEASGVTLAFEVERGHVPRQRERGPRPSRRKRPFGTSRIGVLGITASTASPKIGRRSTSRPVQAVQEASGETWYVVDSTLRYIGGLLVGSETPSQISGPIRIAEVSGEVAKVGFGALINLAAFLSISIGFVNLLPIPLLDGGHLMYFLVEAARGKPMSERTQEFGFKIGLAIVSMLMIFATFNDVLRLVRG